MKTFEDMTEIVRCGLVAQLNAVDAERQQLEEEHGQVWDTQQLQEDFTVKSFAAPFIVVTRKSDGKDGSLFFQHRPRYYWGFQE